MPSLAQTRLTDDHDGNAVGARGDESDPGSLERRLPGYRYGLVLILLFATYVVEASAPESAWTRLGIVVLQGLTLLTALAASRVSRFMMRAATAIVLLAVLAAVASLPAGTGGDNLRGSFLAVNLLLVAVAPVVIAHSLVRRAVVDVRTVLGALCVYVLIGMTFAFGYAVVGAFGSSPFFAQESHATTADYLYFSYVTQTTVGYGDLTAAQGLGRALAVLEALMGQIYLVTIVALLVGSLSRRPAVARGATPAPGRDDRATDSGAPAGDRSVPG